MNTLFTGAAEPHWAEPHWEVSSKGHGRTEHRQVWVSGELAGYGNLPGLSSVVMIKQRVRRRGKPPIDSVQIDSVQIDSVQIDSVQYAVSSRPALSPAEALDLMRGHWAIENSLFHVKDDSLGEDRQVLQTHHGGSVMGLLRNVAVTLLRGTCPLWSEKEPLTGQAQRLAAQPTAAVPNNS